MLGIEKLTGNSGKQKLSIIIAGCGKVGKTLTEMLTREGHDIALIDADSERITNITEQFDVMGVVGNGASYAVQKEAGIENADLLISVTDSDELNLLTCTIAKQVGDCAAIARVRNPDYMEEVGYLRDRLNLAMIINPDLESANAIAHLLYLPGALSVNTFARGLAEMIRARIPHGSRLNGKSLGELGKNIAKDVLICAIEREKEVIIPDGSFILRDGDIISFIASKPVAARFLDIVSEHQKRVESVMIVGGGRSSYYLAKQLLEVGIEVKIIEIDRERCRELSFLLPKATVICGDGSRAEVLEEEGLLKTKAFIPLTGIDEENIVMALHAKQKTNATVVTKINRITFTEALDNLDIGSLFYPKYIVAESIVAYVRALCATKGSNIEALYHLFDNRAEAIEFHVTAASGVTDRPLKELSLKDNLLITCINRAEQIIIPGGNDCIKEGDSVVILTTNTGLKDIGDILK